MKVLLVEDQEEKKSEIVDLVEERFPCDITWVRSYNGAVNELIDNSFQIVLLDMTIPLVDPENGMEDDEIGQLLGCKIIEFIARRGLKTKIIPVSQHSMFESGVLEQSFEELVDYYKKKFPELVMAGVFFPRGVLKSKSDLCEVISKYR